MLKVNGKAYDWGDVDLKIPGLNIQVQEISLRRRAGDGSLRLRLQAARLRHGQL